MRWGLRCSLSGDARPRRSRSGRGELLVPPERVQTSECETLVDCVDVDCVDVDCVDVDCVDVDCVAVDCVDVDGETVVGLGALAVFFSAVCPGGEPEVQGCLMKDHIGAASGISQRRSPAAAAAFRQGQGAPQA